MSIFFNLLEVLGRHKSGSIFGMQIVVLLSSKMDGLGTWAGQMSRKNGVGLDLSHLFSPAATHTSLPILLIIIRFCCSARSCKFTLKNTPFSNPLCCVFDKKDFNVCGIIQEDVSSTSAAENVSFSKFLFPQYRVFKINDIAHTPVYKRLTLN